MADGQQRVGDGRRSVCRGGTMDSSAVIVCNGNMESRHTARGTRHAARTGQKSEPTKQASQKGWPMRRAIIELRLLLSASKGPHSVPMISTQYCQFSNFPISNSTFARCLQNGCVEPTTPLFRTRCRRLLGALAASDGWMMSCAVQVGKLVTLSNSTWLRCLGRIENRPTRNLALSEQPS